MNGDLESLRGVRVPAGFTDRVLRRCGLIDAYALIESPTGPVYMAKSAEGISAVMRAASAGLGRSARHRRRARRRRVSPRSPMHGGGGVDGRGMEWRCRWASLALGGRGRAGP